MCLREGAHAWYHSLRDDSAGHLTDRSTRAVADRTGKRAMVTRWRRSCWAMRSRRPRATCFPWAPLSTSWPQVRGPCCPQALPDALTHCVHLLSLAHQPGSQEGRQQRRPARLHVGGQGWPRVYAPGKAACGRTGLAKGCGVGVRATRGVPKGAKPKYALRRPQAAAVAARQGRAI